MTDLAKLKEELAAKYAPLSDEPSLNCYTAHASFRAGFDAGVSAEQARSKKLLEALRRADALFADDRARTDVINNAIAEYDAGEK